MPKDYDDHDSQDEARRRLGELRALVLSDMTRGPFTPVQLGYIGESGSGGDNTLLVWPIGRGR